ncbi:MAG: DUF1570 domain-containing protein [Planctomycetes bacterium]|nr:DUF1570 domain-containing protein [Planctomycetota bacterium]
MLATKVLALLCSLGPARGDEAAFTAGLAQVAKLAEAEKWVDAKKRLLALLEQHREQDYVRRRFSDIAEELKRLSVRIAVPRPKLDDLLSGKVTKDARVMGDFEVVYAPGTLDDFERREEEVADPAEAKRLKEQPWQGRPPTLVHPLEWNGTSVLEISGTSRNDGGIREDRGWMYVFYALDSQTQLMAMLGSEPPANDVNAKLFPSALLLVEDGESTILAETEDGPPRGTKYQFRLTIERDSFSLKCNGRQLLTAKRAPDRWGNFAIMNVADDATITLRGRPNRQWLSGYVDAHTKDAEVEFLDKYELNADLPDWLQSETVDFDVLTFGATGPHGKLRPDLEKKIDRAFELRHDGDLDGALRVIDDPAIGPGDVRDWCRGVFLRDRGDEAELARHYEAIRKRDPKSWLPTVLHAETLMDSRRFEEARKLLEAAAGELPREPRLFVLRARIGMYEGRPEVARAELDRAAEQGLESPALLQLAMILARLERGPVFAKSYVHDSNHFHVVSDIDKTSSEVMARVLEESFQVYTQFLGKADLGERRFPAYLFSGATGYHVFADEIGSAAPHSTAGIYNRMLKQLLVWNLLDREEVWETVRHEACHQFLDLLGYQPPRWFDEGMAEYASLSVRHGSAGIVEGAVVAGHVRRVLATQEKAPPLAEFVRQTPSEFYSEGVTNYARAWSLIHFLRHGGKPAEAIYERLVAAMRDGADERAVVARAFADVDMAALDQQFRAYVEKLR